MASRTTQARGRERRAAIIAATIDVIGNDGLRGVSYRAVARRAGLPLSTPSFFYPTIDQLLAETIRTVVRGKVEGFRVLATAVDGLPVEEVIDRFVAHVERHPIAEDRALYEAFLMADRVPGLREEVQAVVDITISSAELLILAAGREDLLWAAPVITSLVNGVDLDRVASPERGFAGLREGLLAFVRGLPPAGTSRGGIVER